MSEVIKLMEPLFKEAEDKGLWLESTYQNIPFSPKELRGKMAQGKFCWGPVNWRLIDPRTLFKDAEKLARQAKEYNDNIEARMRS